jgi:hypothetical protein
MAIAPNLTTPGIRLIKLTGQYVLDMPQVAYGLWEYLRRVFGSCPLKHGLQSMLLREFD